MGRDYPDAPAGPFPRPPARLTVGDGREVVLRAVGDGPEAVDVDRSREALAVMYDAFDPADRAQGLPPTGEDRVRDWLDNVLGEGRLNVVAWHGDDAVGHATLVPDDGAYELAIFVLQPYQGAGIGTALVRHLLGHGAENGAERVWLTVERWNGAAVHIYETVGFESSGTGGFELEMALRLA